VFTFSRTDLRVSIEQSFAIVNLHFYRYANAHAWALIAIAERQRVRTPGSSGNAASPYRWRLTWLPMRRGGHAADRPVSHRSVSHRPGSHRPVSHGPGGGKAFSRGKLAENQWHALRSGLVRRRPVVNPGSPLAKPTVRGCCTKSRLLSSAGHRFGWQNHFVRMY